MRKAFEVSRITFHEGIRDRALLGILLLSFCLCGISLFVIPMFAFDTGKVAIDIAFAFISLTGLTIIFFMAIPLLSRDIHHHTVTMILARPVSRGEYILGKYAGLAALIAVAFLVIGTLAILSFWLGVQILPALSLPRNFTWLTLVLTTLLTYQSQLIVLAAAFLFSTITTSSYLAMLLALAVYITGHTIETILKIISAGEFFEASKPYVVTLDIISWILPNLRAFDLKTHVAYGLHISTSYVVMVTLYAAVYITILLSLTIFAFTKKELQ